MAYIAHELQSKTNCCVEFLQSKDHGHKNQSLLKHVQIFVTEDVDQYFHQMSIIILISIFVRKAICDSLFQFINDSIKSSQIQGDLLPLKKNKIA